MYTFKKKKKIIIIIIIKCYHYTKMLKEIRDMQEIYCNFISSYILYFTDETSVYQKCV